MSFFKNIFGGLNPSKAPSREDLDHADGQTSKKRNELLTDLPIVKKTKSVESLPQGQKVDFAKVVKFQLDGEFQKLKKSGQPQKLPVMLSVIPSDVELGKQRVGLDIVIIIDISGSMSGEKIKLVVETLLFIIDEMQDIDRLSLIAFDNMSEILTSLTPMTADNKEKFKKVVVSRIKSRGDTNINKGLVDGFDVLLNRKEVNDVTAMFLLSDGQDTCGNTQQHFNTTLKDYDQKMAAKGMTYKINSFGYGEGHDEKVLGLIANFKEGNFYYIKNVQLVDECFIDCMGYLMSVFGSQAEVSLYMNGKAQIVKKYGSNWAAEANTSKGTLKVGNIAAGKERNFIIEVEVPATEGLPELKVCSAILNFVADGSNHMLEASLVLPVSDEVGPKNAKVEQNVVRLEAAETLKQAEEDVKKGNIAEAKTKFKMFKGDIAKRGVCLEEVERVDKLLDEDILENQKDLYENRDILEAQAFRPMKACYSASNQMQERMLSKKK